MKEALSLHKKRMEQQTELGGPCKIHGLAMNCPCRKINYEGLGTTAGLFFRETPYEKIENLKKTIKAYQIYSLIVTILFLISLIV